jgi:hypothetical protein
MIPTIAVQKNPLLRYLRRPRKQAIPEIKLLTNKQEASVEAFAMYPPLAVRTRSQTIGVINGTIRL